MPRKATHKIEEKAVNIFRSYLTDDRCTYRELSGRDYGIDGLIEVFDGDGFPTGRFIAVQIKGTDTSVRVLKSSDHVSCPNVSVGTMCYAHQDKLPLILVRVSNPESKFYWGLMQALDGLPSRNELRQIEHSKTLRIPAVNLVESAEEAFAMVDQICNEYFAD